MFTYAFYKDCIQALKDKDYQFRRFSDLPYEKERVVYLRHDVDSDFMGTLSMAEIEKDQNVISIYFFQPNNDFYNICSTTCLSVIKKLHELGRDIGLHIDNAICNGQEDLADYIEKTHDFYSNFIPLTRIISFHRPDAKVLEGNLKFDGFVNTYENRFFKEIKYFSDSDHRKFWEQGFYEELEKGTSIQLLTHPFWWGPYEQTVYEAFENYTKKMNQYYASNFKKSFKTYEKALMWLEQE